MLPNFEIMCCLYLSGCHSFICWFYNLNTKQRSSLQRIVKFSSKIVCDQAKSLSLFCDQQILRKVEWILRDPEHALNGDSNACCTGAGSVHWHTKPAKKETFVPTAFRFLGRARSCSHLNCLNHSVWFLLGSLSD